MWWNEKVEIFGYTEDKRDLLFTGTIRDFSNDFLEGEYRIECSDVFDRLKVKLFEREFKIYEYMSEIEDANDINEYRLPFYIDNSVRRGFTYIEDYHENPDKDPYLAIEFRGHIMDFVEMTLKMIFSEPKVAIGVPWLQDKWIDFVDLKSFEYIRNILSGSLYTDFYFVFIEAIDDPFEFIRENILKPCRIFPYITNYGKLGLKLHEQPTSGDGIITLNEDSIVSIRDKKNSINDLVNNISVYYDRNWYNGDLADSGNDQDEFNTIIYAMEEDSVKKNRMLFPKDGPLKFEVEGINELSESDKGTFAQNIIDTYFSRYSTSITEISLTTTLEYTSDITVGDYVFIKHDHLVCWFGDRLGLPGIGEIQESEDEIARFNVGDEWSGFVSNNRLGYSLDGTLIIDTSSQEIIKELFLGPEFSCKSNHFSITEWAREQGV